MGKASSDADGLLSKEASLFFFAGGSSGPLRSMDRLVGRLC